MSLLHELRMTFEGRGLRRMLSGSEGAVYGRNIRSGLTGFISCPWLLNQTKLQFPKKLARTAA
jgi:hypothetical protein